MFSTFEQIKDWSRLPARFLREAIGTLISSGRILEKAVDELGKGFILDEDGELRVAPRGKSEFALHKADLLVKANAGLLKTRFGAYEILQYLLIDGKMTDAVQGYWRIGPHDVDDIVVLLPPSECERRRASILSVVGAHYHPPNSRILRYCGEAVG